MTSLLTLFGKIYGANPAHLLTMLSGFALLGYTLVTITPSASIAVWFVAAVVAHDFVLYPLYTLADRALAPDRTDAQKSRRATTFAYRRWPPG